MLMWRSMFDLSWGWVSYGTDILPLCLLRARATSDAMFWLGNVMTQLTDGVSTNNVMWPDRHLLTPPLLFCLVDNVHVLVHILLQYGYNSIVQGYYIIYSKMENLLTSFLFVGTSRNHHDLGFSRRSLLPCPSSVSNLKHMLNVWKRGILSPTQQHKPNPLPPWNNFQNLMLKFQVTLFSNSI